MCLGHNIQCTECGRITTVVTHPCVAALAAHRCSSHTVSGVVQAICQSCQSAVRGSVRINSKNY